MDSIGTRRPVVPQLVQDVNGDQIVALTNTIGTSQDTSSDSTVIDIKSNIGGVIRWFSYPVAVDFGILTATTHTWGSRTIFDVTMPSGFTKEGLKAFIISGAIGKGLEYRASDILVPGTSAQHTWIHPNSISWNIETMVFRVSVSSSNSVTAQASYFGITLEGSPLGVSYAGDSEAKMWILGAIYSK